MRFVFLARRIGDPRPSHLAADDFKGEADPDVFENPSHVGLISRRKFGNVFAVFEGRDEPQGNARGVGKLGAGPVELFARLSTLFRAHGSPPFIPTLRRRRDASMSRDDGERSYASRRGKSQSRRFRDGLCTLADAPSARLN